MLDPSGILRPMKIVSVDDVRDWYLRARDLAEFTRTIGRKQRDSERGSPVDLPLHLEFAVEQKAHEVEGPVPADAFDSIRKRSTFRVPLGKRDLRSISRGVSRKFRREENCLEISGKSNGDFAPRLSHPKGVLDSLTLRCTIP